MLHKGSLRKRSMHGKGRGSFGGKRWFTLRNSFLFYFEDSDFFRLGLSLTQRVPKQAFNLLRVTRVQYPVSGSDQKEGLEFAVHFDGFLYGNIDMNATRCGRVCERAGGRVCEETPQLCLRP